MPLTSTRLRRKNSSSFWPPSSSPTTPTGSTRAPSSAMLFTALAAPPGYASLRRCRRISTGASRDTREISPDTNSSSTKSPTTQIVCRENAPTISSRRVRSTLASPACAPRADRLARGSVRFLEDGFKEQKRRDSRKFLSDAPAARYHSRAERGNVLRAQGISYLL